jgi:hypothetical protein
LAGDGYGNGAIGAVYCLLKSPNGRGMYIGGTFQTTSSGMIVNKIAYWDGLTFYALQNGTSGLVYALAFHGSDLYVGGTFTYAGR